MTTQQHAARANTHGNTRTTTENTTTNPPSTIPAHTIHTALKKSIQNNTTPKTATTTPTTTPSATVMIGVQTHTVYDHRARIPTNERVLMLDELMQHVWAPTANTLTGTTATPDTNTSTETHDKLLDELAGNSIPITLITYNTDTGRPARRTTRITITREPEQHRTH